MVIHKHSRTMAFSIVRAYNFGKSERLGTGILLAPRKVQERFTATKTTSKLATHGLLEDGEINSATSRTSTGTGSEFSSEFISFSENYEHVPLSLQFTFDPPSTSADVGTSSAHVSIAAPSSQTQSDISFESVSDGETIRSLHAYARPPLHRRNPSDFSPFYHHRHLTKADSLPSSFFRRWLRPPPRLQPSQRLGGDFKVPWLTTTQRSKQDEAERTIDKLNDSFLSARLAPILAKPALKPRESSPTPISGIFGHLSISTFYMILPLWPAESRERAKRKNPPYQMPALEDRCYMLIYYVPFLDKPKRGKKRSRPSPTSSGDSNRSLEDRHILLSEFSVCACVVNYAEMRGSGVRLPSDGLMVGGSEGRALRYDDLASEINDPHGLVIGVYRGKEREVEFVPEGILKLGLCMDPVQGVDAGSKETVLSGLGRAVVEMVWAGCMALSSFGSA